MSQLNITQLLGISIPTNISFGDVKPIPNSRDIYQALPKISRIFPVPQLQNCCPPGWNQYSKTLRTARAAGNCPAPAMSNTSEQ